MDGSDISQNRKLESKITILRMENVISVIRQFPSITAKEIAQKICSSKDGAIAPMSLANVYNYLNRLAEKNILYTLEDINRPLNGVKINGVPVPKIDFGDPRGFFIVENAEDKKKFYMAELTALSKQTGRPIEPKHIKFLEKLIANSDSLDTVENVVMNEPKLKRIFKSARKLKGVSFPNDKPK